jgi:hypothetical protein
MKFTLILLSTTFLLTVSYSQTKDLKTLLSQKFRLADSVSITSHEPTSGIVLVDSLGKEIPLPNLLKNNKPNYKIVKEHKLLLKTSIDSLINILGRPFKDKVISVGGCYVPRQTIFIFKGNKLSYIDICFHCRNYETSKDLSFLHAFDKRKWNELEGFFIRQGLSYELIDE